MKRKASRDTADEPVAVKLDTSTAIRLVNCFSALFESLPPSSALRAPLARRCFRDSFPVDSADYCAMREVLAGIVGVKEGTLRLLLQDEGEFDAQLLDGCVRPTTRPRKVDEKDAALGWVVSNLSNTKSGSISATYYHSQSVWHSYLLYRDEFERSTCHDKIISPSIFYQLCKKLHVKVNRHQDVDQFACPHCRSGLTAIEDELRSASTEKERILLNQKKEALLSHQLLHNGQRRQIENEKANLRPGEMMCFVDFTAFCTPDASVKDAPCFVCVCYFRETADGLLYKSTFFCFGVSEERYKKDSVYFVSVLRSLHTAGFFTGFNRVLFVSDTGTASFRNRYTMFAVRQLQDDSGIAFEFAFYENNHGHNVSDSITGTAKSVIRKEAQHLNGSGLKWMKQFVEQSVSLIQGCNVLNIHIDQKWIDREEGRQLQGINNYLWFTFPAKVSNLVHAYLWLNDTEVKEFKLA